MDLKIMMVFCFVLVALLSSCEAGKHKKVVIHVPLKIKKIKHTHTIYKTIHHHHKGHHKAHHGFGGLSKGDSSSEEHEHFHHQGHFSHMDPVYAVPDYSILKKMGMGAFKSS